MNTKHPINKGSMVPEGKLGISFQHPQATMGKAEPLKGQPEYGGKK